jgi:hypothetical protein
MAMEDWIQHSTVARFLYDWQTLIAGVLALLAARIADGHPEVGLSSSSVRGRWAFADSARTHC